MDLYVRFELEHRGAVFGLDRRRLRFLVEELALELDFQVFVASVRGAELEPRILERLLELGIVHLENHGVGLDVGSRKHEDAIDSPFRARGEPANFYRNEGARAAHLTEHRPPSDRVHPHLRPIDRRSRRLELQNPSGEDQKQDATDRIQDSLFALARFDDPFPFYIHY